MKIGDTVTWTSQDKSKTGVIVDAVWPYRSPSEHFNLRTSSKRSHTSYVIKVGSKYYWPHKSKLHAA